MSDAPRRPILKLKSPPPMPVAPAAPRAPKPVAAPAGERWKCKPCGTAFSLTGAEAAEETIRCPACNARLGAAADFRDPAGKVRARRVDA